MPTELRHAWRSNVRSLWFVPSLFVVGALVAGALLSQVTLTDGFLLSPIIFRGTAGAARELLIVVSGTMITVTGLVFVLTVVALQIASTQFSPRLLRSFLEDPGTRLVLGVFVATFAYSLGGLFTVGQTTDDGQEFVPRLAVTGSLLLALLSVGMLIYYIQHITNSIRIDRVMLGIRRATIRSLGLLHPEPADDSEASEFPSPPPGALRVTVAKSGYIQEVDAERLRRAAEGHGATVVVRPQVGDHVVAGSVLAWVWDADLGFGDVASELSRSVVISPERHVDDDIGFGVRQLVDIAMRAVAPSVNDPYTAVQAIHHLSIVMAEMSTRATADVRVVDGDRLVLFAPVPDFALHLDTICSTIRPAAAHRTEVMLALLGMLEAAAADATEPRRRLIAEHVDLITADAERVAGNPRDLEAVRETALRVKATVESIGSPHPSTGGRHQAQV